jgi:hypothetical protein
MPKVMPAGILPFAIVALAALACGRSDSRPAPTKPAATSAPEPVLTVKDEIPSSAPIASAPAQAAAPAGPSGKVLVCDGQADRGGTLPGARIPVDRLFQDVKSLTVELWFRPDALLELHAPPEYVLSAHRQGDGRTDQNTDLSLSIRDAREDRLAYFHVRHRGDGTCTGVYGTPASRAPLAKGRWYHLAATYERTAKGEIAMHTFLDGQSASSSVTATPDEPCVAPIELTLCQGVTPTGIFSRPFVGALDDVHISRVVRYREAFVPGPPTRDADTLVLLRFDSGTLFDDGPHALRGTVVGSPAFASVVR